MNSMRKRVLIMTAVTAEQDAVLRGLKKKENVDVFLAGVGPIAAAANTAKILETHDYKWVISAGIAGGFPNKAEIGSLVIAEDIVASDLGVETLEGFCSLDEMGFGLTRFRSDLELVSRLAEALRAAKLPVVTGPVITVSTATGTAENATEMSRRVPGVVAEGMEGFGVAQAAQIFEVPIFEIRAISNGVGPRDKDAWKIREALEALEKAFSVLSEIL
jgi:futalosine hydrolase